jgi:hypothetical protein
VDKQRRSGVHKASGSKEDHEKVPDAPSRSLVALGPPHYVTAFGLEQAPSHPHAIHPNFSTHNDDQKDSGRGEGFHRGRPEGASWTIGCVARSAHVSLSSQCMSVFSHDIQVGHLQVDELHLRHDHAAHRHVLFHSQLCLQRSVFALDVNQLFADWHQATQPTQVAWPHSWPT